MTTLLRSSAQIALAAAVVLAGSARADDGTVYVWVDANGQTHYQDTPPESGNAQEMNLRYRMTDPKAVAQSEEKKADLHDATKLRETQQSSDNAQAAAERDATLKQRAENCKQAQDRMTRYETAHRLYKPGADGERQYLSDKELDAARADARESVKEWCD